MNLQELTKRTLDILEEFPVAITQLDGGHNATVATITVDSTTGFKSSGRIQIDTENIDYTGTTATTFTGCTRGAGLSVAASHSDNAKVIQTGAWNQEQIRGYLNTAQMEFAKRTLCLETDATENSVSGTQQYTLPANFYKLKHPGGCFWHTGQNRRELDYLDVARGTRLGNTATGTPTHFWLWRNEVWLYPIPGTTANNMIQIYYHKKPATMTLDGDSPDIDSAYHEDLVWYAAWRCLLVDNGKQALAYKQLWDAALEQAQFDSLTEFEGPTYIVDAYQGVDA